VGHHPHVLQGIEEYNGVNIVYSLGNFCFGGNKNPSDKDTMIYQQTFTFVDGQLVDDIQDNIIPCSLSSTSSYNDYRPTPATGDEAERILNKIQTRSDEI
jgi:poly-gamma-glutamate synthesis protein (capsule biosynthesis protein)